MTLDEPNLSGLDFELGLSVTYFSEPQWAFLKRVLSSVTILGITKLYTQIPSMIRIFPNPVHHTIKINVPENLIKQTCIFYNNFGQQVYNCILEDRETTLSLPFLSCGLYYIQIGPHCFIFTKTT